MGTLLKSICNHKLPAENIETLAASLAEAFHINIEYENGSCIEFSDAIRDCLLEYEPDQPPYYRLSARSGNDSPANGDYSLDIYKESAVIYLDDIIEKKDFYYFFQHDDEKNRQLMKDMDRYRRLVKGIAKSIGGNKVYHFPDDCSGEIIYKNIDLSWEQRETASIYEIEKEGYHVFSFDEEIPSERQDIDIYDIFYENL